MKFPLLLAILPILASQAADLRLIGTNLYDFSDAGQSPHFRVRGQVGIVYPESVQVLTPTMHYRSIQSKTRFRLSDSPPVPVSEWMPEDQITALAACKIAQKGDIYPGQYLSMSPNLRRYFEPVVVSLTNIITADQYARMPSKANYEPFQVFSTNYLVNYPSALKPGTLINCLALPTKDKGFFNHGIQFKGDTNLCQVRFKLVSDHIESLAK